MMRDGRLVSDILRKHKVSLKIIEKLKPEAVNRLYFILKLLCKYDFNFQ